MQIGGWSDDPAEAPSRTASTETLDETTLPGTTWQTDTGKQLNVARAHQNTVLLPGRLDGHGRRRSGQGSEP